MTDSRQRLLPQHGPKPTKQRKGQCEKCGELLKTKKDFKRHFQEQHRY